MTTEDIMNNVIHSWRHIPDHDSSPQDVDFAALEQRYQDTDWLKRDGMHYSNLSVDTFYGRICKLNKWKRTKN